MFLRNNEEIHRNKQFRVRKRHYLPHLLSDLKFGDGDGPNLCRVKKVYVSSTFIVIVIRLRFQGYCCESEPTKFNEGSRNIYILLNRFIQNMKLLIYYER